MKKLSQRQLSIVLLLGAILLGILCAVVGQYVYRMKYPTVDSYAECKAAGYPIMESYPEQCSANGQTFVNTISSYEECIEAGNPSLKSNPPACEAQGQLFRQGED